MDFLHKLVLLAATKPDGLNGASIVNKCILPAKRVVCTHRDEDGPDDVARHLRVVARLHEVIQTALQLGDDSADEAVSKRRPSRHLYHSLRVPAGTSNCPFAKNSNV
jgi:hypothetical protein